MYFKTNVTTLTLSPKRLKGEHAYSVFLSLVNSKTTVHRQALGVLGDCGLAAVAFWRTAEGRLQAPGVGIRLTRGGIPDLLRII